MKFIVQGKVLSKVVCQIERQKQAERSNIDVELVPLKYGSLRLGVNIIKIDNTVYSINRKSDLVDIKEERLILEISYKFNTDGSIVDEHSIIDEINLSDEIDLSMDSAYVGRNHYLKLINVGINTTIKSYFIKSWADRIEFLSPYELQSSSNLITPKLIVQKISQDKSLIIV